MFSQWASALHLHPTPQGRLKITTFLKLLENSRLRTPGVTAPSLPHGPKVVGRVTVPPCGLSGAVPPHRASSPETCFFPGRPPSCLPQRMLASKSDLAVRALNCSPPWDGGSNELQDPSPTVSDPEERVSHATALSSALLLPPPL